jgi:predicted RNA-binding Zn-ribbon protein involved in translation (DUF1610 family)
MNHEIPFVCPNCGEEYDAHLHWYICPKCGIDAVWLEEANRSSRENVTEKK